MGQIRFILGRAGSGKSKYCLDSIARLLRRSPLDGPAVVLLVPEQATYQMERALARWRGLCGYLRGRVISFDRLAREVQRASSPPTHRPMLATSRVTLARRIVGQVRGELRFWKRCPPDQIAGSILRLLDELTRADLTGEQLERFRSSLLKHHPSEAALADKLHDLILLLKEFRGLDLAGLDDPRRYLEHYRDHIDRIDWLKGATVYVDGFAGFSGQEYVALAATAKVARSMYITLCLDPAGLDGRVGPGEWDCFGQVRATYDRLVRLTGEHGIAVGPAVTLRGPGRRRFVRSGALAKLEERLALADDSAVSAASDDVELVEAHDRLAEVTLAAGKIIELVRDRQYRFRQISVVVRDLFDYESYIRDVFDEFEIPYFLDARRPIGRTPLARLICGALAAVVNNYKTSSMLRYLKSGLVNIPADKVALIENYVLAHGIDGDGWLGTWRRNLDLIGFEDDEGHTEGAVTLDELNKYRRELTRPLVRLADHLARGGEADAEFEIDFLLTGLAGLLDDLQVAGRLCERIAEATAEGSDISAQMHRQGWQSLSELFAQLRLTLGARPLRAGEFLRILQDSFNELTVGVVPASLDQVLIGSIDRSRHPSVRATFVLGFNEGNFPQPAVDDVMLTDSERELLGWADLDRPADVEAHYSREQYLAYIALTRPGEFLWVSYPQYDRQGRRLVPSRYLARLEPISGPAEMRRCSLTNTPVGVSSVSAGLIEAIDRGPALALALGMEKSSEDFWLGIASGLLADPSRRSVFKRQLEVYQEENKVELSAGLAGSMYGDKVSLSQLESYYRCPFQHFCRYGLRVAPRRLYRLEPVDLGQFRHLVMHRAWGYVKELSDRTKVGRDGFAETLIRETVDNCTRSMRDHVLFSTARNRYIFERVTAELVLAFRWQLRNFLAGSFEPAGLEEKFSIPVDPSNAEGLRLVGRIDRVDLTDGEQTWAAVFDYKSSETKFDFGKWFAGVQLQLPGYTLVAVDAGLTGTARSEPAAAVFLPLSPKGGSVGADNADIAGLFAGSGLVNERAIDLLIDRQRSTGREFGFTLGKNGEPTRIQYGSLVTADQFHAILRYTQKLIVDAARQMGTGRIAIEPYRKKREGICSFCDFRTICRFDPFVNRYRTVEDMGKQSILARVLDDGN